MKLEAGSANTITSFIDKGQGEGAGWPGHGLGGRRTFPCMEGVLEAEHCTGGETVCASGPGGIWD